MIHKYTTWRDLDRGCFEVVRWNDRHTPEVIQTGILTREKADRALKIWRQRDRAEGVPRGAPDDESSGGSNRKGARE